MPSPTKIEHNLKDHFGEKLMGMEGYAAGTWVLQDYGDLVIHLLTIRPASITPWNSFGLGPSASTGNPPSLRTSLSWIDQRPDDLLSVMDTCREIQPSIIVSLRCARLPFSLGPTFAWMHTNVGRQRVIGPRLAARNSERRLPIFRRISRN